MARALIVNGFMATGKSTVGRLVSELAGLPFVDLDARIAQTAGASIPQIFQSRGEQAFRALERAELERVLDHSGSAPPVVALGGGALLDREARLRALDSAVVVCLTASPAEIVRRAEPLSSRPLLDVRDPRSRVAELLEARHLSYCEGHARLATDGVAPAELARRILDLWQRDPVCVAAGERSYNIEIGAELLSSRLPELVRGASSALLVTDANVARLHGARAETALSAAGSRTVTVVLEPGEEHKHIGSVERIWKAAQAAGLDRTSTIVALGGGVVSDVAGFAAASFMRGIRWAVLPTTLLSMVDASVGGKTGVDLGPAKNAVGAFWQPSGVVCDVALLRTEPVRGFSSAFSEVVKTALIGDPELFGLLETRATEIRSRDPTLLADIVRRCVRVKARIVSFDERESGLRATLNLGHTVGHALEAQGGYSRLTHGEAISLGLVAALRIGERMGKTPAALARRATALLESLGLPVELEKEPLAGAAALIGHDKKRAGKQLKFAFAREIGRVDLENLELDALRERILSLQ